jgi:hypothetical protein
MTNQKINRDSFIFYRSFYLATKCLNQAEKAQLFDTICSYALDNEMGELDGTAKGMFELIKPQLDANRKRFENGCVKKQKISKTEAKPKQKISKTEANVNENVNVNEECKLELINDTDNNISIKKDIIKKQNHLESEFCKEVVDTLQNHLQTTLNKKITTANWQKQIELLLDKDLKPRGIDIAKEDIITCMQAVIDNHKEDYFPVIESASAFRDKFSKIEDFLKRKNNLNKNFTNGMTAKQKENYQAFADFGNNKFNF